MTENNNMCVICQENINNNMYELPTCGHKYHINCIISWFREYHSSCPLCNDNGINITEYINYMSLTKKGKEKRVELLKKYCDKKKNEAPRYLKNYIKELQNKKTELLKTKKI
tara:strand:- start:449 stop:784 length:336 start_codon:yes stop_codon:yes gene_type:complete